jgi:hypothetical protein
MIEETILAKIRKVYLVDQKAKGPRGKVYHYPCWTGWYREEGKRKRVYLGRELPERFKDMVPVPRLTRSPKNYNWPRSVHGKNAGDPGLLQVGGR